MEAAARPRERERLFSERVSEPVRRQASMGVESAVAVEVEGDRVSGWPDEVRSEGAVIRFVHCRVDQETAETLAEVLLDGAGVLPTGVESNERGVVSVPLLEPTEFGREEVVWRVTDELAVMLLHRGEVWFERAAEEPVVLDGPGAWRLLRALVSTRVGERQLESAALRAMGEMAGLAGDRIGG